MLDVLKTTVQVFEEKILRGALNMISPDVMIQDGKGTVLVSSEDGETKENMNKNLSVRFFYLPNNHTALTCNFHIMQDFGISDGTRLRCEDFHQEYDLNVTIAHRYPINNYLCLQFSYSCLSFTENI